MPKKRLMAIGLAATIGALLARSSLPGNRPGGVIQQMT